jgi:hypothetical protein
MFFIFIFNLTVTKMGEGELKSQFNGFLFKGNQSILLSYNTLNNH